MSPSLPQRVKRLLTSAYYGNEFNKSCRVLTTLPRYRRAGLVRCPSAVARSPSLPQCAPAFLSPAWGYVCAWARTPPSPSIISIIILPLLLSHHHHHHLQSCCHSDAARNIPPGLFYRLLALDEVGSRVEVVAAIVDPLLFPAQPSSS